MPQRDILKEQEDEKSKYKKTLKRFKNYALGAVVLGSIGLNFIQYLSNLTYDAHLSYAINMQKQAKGMIYAQKEKIRDLKFKNTGLENDVKNQRRMNLALQLKLIKKSPDIDLVTLRGNKEQTANKRNFFEKADKYSNKELMEILDSGSENFVPFAFLTDVNKDGIDDILGYAEHLGDVETPAAVRYGKKDGTFGPVQDIPYLKYKKTISEAMGLEIPKKTKKTRNREQET
jgi:hypothetical protein